MAADPKAVRRYLESQILTAPREQLLLMMLDGALRFSLQARRAFGDQKIEDAVQALIRAERIVLELMNALDRNIGEETYRNLMGLYGFVYLRLVRAGTRRDGASIDEALAILERLRGMWGDAVARMRRDQSPEARLIEEAQQRQGAVSAAAPPASGLSVHG